MDINTRGKILNHNNNQEKMTQEEWKAFKHSKRRRNREIAAADIQGGTNFRRKYKANARIVTELNFMESFH